MVVRWQMGESLKSIRMDQFYNYARPGQSRCSFKIKNDPTMSFTVFLCEHGQVVSYHGTFF